MLNRHDWITTLSYIYSWHMRVSHKHTDVINILYIDKSIDNASRMLQKIKQLSLYHRDVAAISAI